MDIQTKDKTEAIRNLNDRFRATFVGGTILTTSGFAALDATLKATVLEKVRTFEDFSGDNDPHGEHDFGSIDEGGQKFFWKLDYYDRTMEAGSEDPADPSKTTRVLTIMLASEY